MKSLIFILLFVSSAQSASFKRFDCNNLDFAKKRLSISGKNFLSAKNSTKDHMRATLAANIIRSYAANNKCNAHILMMEGEEMFLINYPMDKDVSTDRLVFGKKGSLELWERVSNGKRQSVRF